jgi:hypothetical protein
MSHTAALAAASPRPQTANLPYGSTSPRHGGGAGAGGGAGGPVPADPSGPVLVRLYHPVSRKFLHVSPETGLASMQSPPEPPAAPVYHGRGGASAAAPAAPLFLGAAFELVQQHGAPPPHPSWAGTEARPTASKPPSRGGEAVGGGGLLAQPYGSTGSTLGGASRAGASQPRGARPVVPLRGFDMATGGLQNRREEGNEDADMAAWALGLPGADLLGAHAAGMREGGLATAGGAGAGAGVHLLPGDRSVHGRHAAQRPASSSVSAGDSARRRERGDETRRTAWDASQLDLSDVIRPGLNLGSLFGGAPSDPPVAHGVYRASYSSRPPSSHLAAAAAPPAGGYRPAVVTSLVANTSARGGGARSAELGRLGQGPRSPGRSQLTEPAHLLAPQLYGGVPSPKGRASTAYGTARPQRFQAGRY